MPSGESAAIVCLYISDHLVYINYFSLQSVSSWPKLLFVNIERLLPPVMEK